MSEQKITPLQFAEKYLRPYKTNGAEIVPELCPLCNGGSAHDRNTFALNMYTGAWNCKRGSCGQEGAFNQLTEAFGEEGEAYCPAPVQMNKKKEYERPTLEIHPPTEQIIKYMGQRKISPETLGAFGVGSDASGNIVFPFYRGGELIYVKYRYPRKLEKGERKAWQDKNTEPILMGMDNCAFNSQLTVCEGEVDALSLYEAGVHNVVSVPSGAQNLEWVDLCWDWLEKFDDILIFGDADEPGQEMVRKLTKMLGEARVSTITEYPSRPGDEKSPCKDANEILYFYGPEKLKEMVDSAPKVEIKGIIRLADVKRVDYTTLPRIRTGIPKLDEVTGGLFDASLTLITGQPSAGKLLADDTDVLTRSGWKKHGELQVGDEVIGKNGEFVKVQHIFPKHYANMRVTLTSGEQFDCHEEHEWLVLYASNGLWKEKIMTAKELFEKGSSREGLSEICYVNNQGKHHYWHRVPEGAVIAGEERTLHLDPYTMGVWLGDGITKSPTICSSQEDVCVIERVISKGNKVAWETKHKDTSVLYFGFDGMRQKLANYGLCHSRKIKEKYIPHDYLLSPVEDRLQLLAGLLDTDGYANKETGMYSFSTTSERLRDGFISLVSSFGWRVNIVTEQPKTSTSGIVGRKKVYIMSFCPTISIPCEVPRKQLPIHRGSRRVSFKTVEYIDPVPGNCIQVENGLYRIGRSLTLTHNSTLNGTLLLNAVEQGYNVFAYSGELPKEKFLDWTLLQAAGGDYIGLKHDNYRKISIPYVAKDVETAITSWFYDKFYLADNSEIGASEETESILHLCEQAARRYGCHLFLIDNAMTAVSGANTDERAAQIKLARNLKRFALRYNAHVILVAHPRKVAAGQSLTGDDVSGAKEFYNLSDTMFEVDKPDIRIIKNRDMGVNTVIPCVYCPDSRRIYQADVGDTYDYSWNKANVKKPEVLARSMPEYVPRMKQIEPI